jgi:hypothetical protein
MAFGSNPGKGFNVNYVLFERYCIMAETQDHYLDRICGTVKPKKIRKPKANEIQGTDEILPGYSWNIIQAMQQGTYKARVIK